MSRGGLTPDFVVLDEVDLVRPFAAFRDPSVVAEFELGDASASLGPFQVGDEVVLPLVGLVRVTAWVPEEGRLEAVKV